MQTPRPIYLGFFLLGVVGVILGPLLPDLETRWSITHEEVAVLFLAQFGASSIGAILSTLNLRASLVWSYPLLAVGLAILATGNWALAPPAMALFGVGFGLCLPATNLLVAQANPNRSGAAVSTLNMIWGVGAVTCPLLLMTLAGRVATTQILWTLSACLLAVGVAIAIGLKAADFSHQNKAPRAEAHNRPDYKLLLILALTLFFYVGTENTFAGWIVVLGDEIGGSQLSSSLLLGSLFWAAQALGRGLAPLALQRLSERRLFNLLIAVACSGVVLVLSADTRIGLGVGTTITGLGSSALFPLTVSRLSIAAVGLRGGSGWVFAFGAIGGALLPWLTGRLSGVTGRIQSAFLVPLVSLTLVAALGFLTTRLQDQGAPRDHS
jgi:FHS family glucose/mannose:H+ symporter-like MFS transporter